MFNSRGSWKKESHLHAPLLARIERAFPKWDPKSPSFLPLKASPEDYAKLRDTLYHIAAPSVPKHLGIVLYELLLNHPPELADDTTYMKLAFFLDANVDESEEIELRSFSKDQLDVPQSEIDAIEDVQRARYLDFTEFTGEQTAILVDWLKVASTWECSKPYRMEIESALRFWERLSEH